MSNADRTYHDLIQHILKFGEQTKDRTGTGTLRVFNHQMSFDISQSFPLLTTKRMAWSPIVHELIWFISGNTNIKYLQDNKVRIWNEWANENGDLGPVYGHQWRKWKTSDGEEIDQLAQLIKNIKQDPFSRRHILSAWNVGELNQMALPPCHLLCQFYVSNSGTLSCKLFQRSADVFLGVPFNIASYSLLTYMIAAQCNLTPGEFVWSGTDCHIYLDHIDKVKTQLERSPYKEPTVTLKPAMSIDNYTANHVELHNYKSHEKIAGKISV